MDDQTSNLAAQASPANPQTPSAGISPVGQLWDAAAYAAHGRFVADLAAGVVDLLAPQPGERILDIGCGDGALSMQIAESGAYVTGIDASSAMIAAARTRGLDARLIPATELTFHQEFDAAFSNAALHWIPESDQLTALGRIHTALKSGGRFIAEMGGQGNIAAIRTALSAALAPFGIDGEASAASFFPSPARFNDLLQQVGFEVRSIALIPRPTALPGGPDGLATWLNTFRNGVLGKLSTEDRAEAVLQIVNLLRPILSDNGNAWTADYVRLRFHAFALSPDHAGS